MRITDYLGEATEYDKKETLEERKPKSWLKSISAFANGIGGVLFFGVSDDERLVGLHDAKSVSEKISEMIKTKMDPIPAIVLSIHREDNKEFIVVTVPAGEETPYYYVGDGNRIAFVRVGNESHPASAVDLKRLVLRGSHITYDSLPSRYPLGSLAFTKLRSIYRMRTGKEFTDADFISCELVDENSMLTNAGVLLADDCPLRHSRLFCTRWNGNDKASGVIDALDDREYSGSLISLLQDGIEFVNNNSKKSWKKTGNGRIEMPEYPEQAVHETIVNALIHRDYTEVGSEVHIDIYDNRLEVYSPGGMFDGSIVQNLDTDYVASKRRNPIIADVFSRMNYMERRGSGFRKIKADYRNAVNYRDELAPVFKSTATSFFTILYNLHYSISGEKVLISPEKLSVGGKKVLIDSEKLSVGNEKVLIGQAIDTMNANKNTRENAGKLFAYMQFDGIFGRKDIMELTDISITAAGNLLNSLKNADLIVPVAGFGKGKYQFKMPTESH